MSDSYTDEFWNRLDFLQARIMSLTETLAKKIKRDPLSLQRDEVEEFCTLCREMTRMLEEIRKPAAWLERNP